MVTVAALPALAHDQPALAALLAALLAAALAGAGEWLHARRVRRVARLAFGPAGRPAAWVAAVPVLRTLAVGAGTWSLVVLALLEPTEVDREPTRAASRHLLIALDASPSMLVKDAGPGLEKVSRAQWGGRVVQGILDRLDMEVTRVSLVAFYTDALPVITDTFDKELVRNALDGLPMYTAFEPGATDVQGGVAKALEQARAWMPGSSALVVLSDGDTITGPPPERVPASIADVIVIGVGDPHRSTAVGGHGSRQDAPSLKQLAARLGGIYHDGNEKHLPSAVIDRLSMIQPRLSDGTGLRELALLLLGAAAGLLAGIAPALEAFGRRRAVVRARRRVTARGAEANAGLEAGA